MPDKDPDLLAEFQEFLTQREANAKAEAESEDFEVEIWDKDGRGVRTRRSHAKPFLNSLGIDIEPDPESSDDGSDNSGDNAGKGKSKGPRQSKTPPTGTQSTVRKYFAKPGGAAK